MSKWHEQVCIPRLLRGSPCRCDQSCCGIYKDGKLVYGPTEADAAQGRVCDNDAEEA